MADVVVLPNLDALSEEAARRWIEIANAAVDARGEFSIALAGGNTPRSLYQIMASPPCSEQAPWAQTFIFFGDERRVPPDHADSNFRMAQETLLEHVPIPAEQIHRMGGQGLARTAAQDYQRTLEHHFSLGRREFPRIDLVLLGMGADGHTASIFPGTRAVSDLTNMVMVYDVPQSGQERMTLGPSVINNARNILFLVSGENKADALASVLHGEYRPSTFPAQVVKPRDGSLTFLVDKAAAANLPT